MKDINSLSELIEYVQGRGVTCEVSQLYSLCEKLEEENKSLKQGKAALRDRLKCSQHNYNVQVANSETAYQNYVKMVNSLEEQIQGLQSLLDLKQQERSVLESKVFELEDSMDNSDEAIRRRYAKWAYPNEPKQN